MMLTHDADSCWLQMQGWQGVQIIPRVVTYDADLDELVFYPIVEVEQLRTETLYIGNVTLNQVCSASHSCALTTHKGIKFPVTQLVTGV